MTFEYEEPTTLDGATNLLRDDPDAVALAGGTSFVLLHRQGLLRPSRVVGLRRIDGLRGIAASPDGLWIGALTTHREIETSPLIRDDWPVLADAVGSIGTIRIRNQGTIGGNLVHADPAQDPPPILIALDASVEVAGPGGATRSVPVEALFIDYLTTVLEPGELVTGVQVPRPGPARSTVYRKFLPRSADDYATVAVAVSVQRGPDGRVADARVALGGVGTTPIRVRAVEAALIGARPGAGAIGDAAALVDGAISPIDDARGSAAYKRAMAIVWVRRAITEALA